MSGERDGLMTNADDPDIAVEVNTSTFIKNDLENQPLVTEAERKKTGYYTRADVDRIRVLLGTSYMMAMGVCGVVLTAIGTTLDQIAEDCGTTSTAIGSVFIARGAGAIVGALCCSTLYRPPNKGNNVMIVTLILLTGLLMYVPWITSVVSLHFVFAGMGFCTAVTDTGCQIMTRKVHGIHSGPWLGANTVVFGVAGALVPLVDIVTTDLVTMYTILSVITVATFGTMLSMPSPEDRGIQVFLPPNSVRSSSTPDTPPVNPLIQKYYVNEFIIGNMVFWFIGGKVLCSSYIESYISASSVVEASKKEVALCVVWIGIAIGRFVGLNDQVQLNKQGVNGIHGLYTSFGGWIFCGLCGGLLMFSAQQSSMAFWVSLVLYGFGNGPCVGYAYDLNNRLTVMTELGMSIVMFGLNFGASIVPYVATIIWDDTAYSYRVLPLVLFISMVVPGPLLASTRVINQVSRTSFTNKDDTNTQERNI